MYIANIEDLIDSAPSASLTDIGAPLRLDSSVKVMDIGPVKNQATPSSEPVVAVESKQEPIIAKETPKEEYPIFKKSINVEDHIDLPSIETTQYVSTDISQFEPIFNTINERMARIESMLTHEGESTYEPSTPQLKKAFISIKDLVDTEFDYYSINTVGQCVVFVIPTGSFNLKTRSSTKVELSVEDVKSDCVLVEKPIPLLSTGNDILIFFAIPPKNVDSEA